MADYNKVKEFLASLSEEKEKKNKSNNDNSAFLKLPTGKHVLRILPNPFDDMFFVRTFIHWNVGGASFFSLKKMFNNSDDPIDKFCYEIWGKYAEGGKTDKFLLRIFKYLMAKERYYIPVVKRGEEEKGGRWFSLTAANGEAIISDAFERFEEDKVRVEDLKQGVDLEVEMEPFPEDTRKAQVKRLKFARKSSPLTPSDEENDKIVASLIDMMGQFKTDGFLKSVEEVENLLDAYMTEVTSSNTDKKPTGTEKYFAKMKKRSAEEAVKDTDAADDDKILSSEDLADLKTRISAAVDG